MPTGALRTTGIAGGAETETHNAFLDVDRQRVGARSGFDRPAVEGSGTLSLTLDQGLKAVSLVATRMNATLDGSIVGSVMRTDGAERAAIDCDVRARPLGTGDDVPVLGPNRAIGRSDGSANSDMLRYIETALIVLMGTATGFEQCRSQPAR